MTRSMTSLSAPRFRLALWAVFLGTLGLSLVVLRHIAHAAQVIVADPLATATAVTDGGWSLVSSYGPIWGGFLLLATALGTFLHEQHWIKQGRTLAVLTGLSMTLGAVIAWHFNGAPLAGVVVTAFMAIKLVWGTGGAARSSSSQAGATLPARNPQAGMVGGNVITWISTFAVLGGIALWSCTSSQRTEARQTAAAGVVAALDCELLHVDGDVMADARLFADAKVQGWISGVKPGDTAALQDRIAADLKPVKSDLGHCAITGALAAATVVLSPTATSSPGTSSTAQGLTAADPVQLRAAFAVAARAAGWAPVKLAGGAVL